MSVDLTVKLPDFRAVASPWFRLGFCVIPGGLRKTPFFKWGSIVAGAPEGYVWSGEDLDDLAEQYPRANPLLLVDSGAHVKLVVIDVDDAGLTDWVLDRFGDTPLWTTTGRDGGGVHLLYRKHEGAEKIKSRNGLIGPLDVVEWGFEADPTTGRNKKKTGWGRTKIDLKSWRSYVIAPEGVHPTGRIYRSSIRVEDLTVEFLKNDLPVFDHELYERLVADTKARARAESEAARTGRTWNARRPVRRRGQ